MAHIGYATVGIPSNVERCAEESPDIAEHLCAFV